MGTWQFEVDGPLKGFIVHARPWTRKAKDYCAFKNRVRYIASLVGCPDEIPIGYTASIHVDISWRKLARTDSSNILKVLEDSVFKQDRRVGEIHVKRHQHTGTERAVVTVRIERD